MSAPQPDIRDYAAIGDCRSVALVSRSGSIDWFCSPVFSAPSLFAALLDAEKGGCFAVAPPGADWAAEPEQAYEPRSNVVRTRFRCRAGVLELLDFMSVPEAGGATPVEPAQEIVRIVRCVEGSVQVAARFDPRPGYASEPVSLQQLDPSSWRCAARSVAMVLSSTLPFAPDSGGALAASARMQAGEEHALLMQVPATRPASGASLRADAQDRLAATLAWWRAWCDRCVQPGPYSEAVLRSALALKLLTHRPTGAVVAAATTSLPEGETGARNWDYRFCWLRDSSLVLRAFSGLGYTAEGDAFLRWLLHATRATRPRLQVVYDVHGEQLLPEQVVPHLRGWRGIGPVRIGNAASDQVQHDIYGEVMLAAWDHARCGGSLDEAEKALLAGFVQVVCGLWREPDHGIWEIRLPPRHNTHSKLMCWAALDCGLKLHESHRIPIDPARVRRERDAIRADIDAHGFDTALGSYVGFYGSRAVDASLLVMPRVGYLEPTDPRMLGTLREIDRQLSVHGLLYRYPTDSGYDGVPGPEHLFVICNFWAVDCLARQGRVDEALAMYERLLALRNHVGLYAEEFGAEDGRPMGNFPQAFSHVGLITGALALQAAQQARHGS